MKLRTLRAVHTELWKERKTYVEYLTMQLKLPDPLYMREQLLTDCQKSTSG